MKIYVEFIGPSGVGKTTICKEVVEKFLREGYIIESIGLEI